MQGHSGQKKSISSVWKLFEGDFVVLFLDAFWDFFGFQGRKGKEGKEERLLRGRSWPRAACRDAFSTHVVCRIVTVGLRVAEVACDCAAHEWKVMRGVQCVKNKAVHNVKCAKFCKYSHQGEVQITHYRDNPRNVRTCTIKQCVNSNMCKTLQILGKSWNHILQRKFPKC